MIRRGQLKRDVPCTLWGVDVVLPTGTIVQMVGGGSASGDFWAVSDVGLLMKLTGNRHDPVYRWAMVPADAVELRT